jgi:hypothetical protein
MLRYAFAMIPALCWGSAGGCARDPGVAKDPLVMAFDTIAIIGAMDGAEHEVLGRLTTATVHDQTGVFLVDVQAGAVRWYDSDGVFVRTVNSRGKGPGELETPWALYVDRDTTLWVLDQQNARISQFTIRNEGSVAYVGSIPGVFPEGSMCSLQGRMYAAGLRSGRTLHELKADGIAGSWGPAPDIEGIERAGDWRFAAEQQVLQGRVHCADKLDIIIVGLASHPLVRAFDATGAVRWETKMDGFSPFGFTVADNGSLRGQIDPENGAYFLRSMVPWDDRAILLQYEVRLPVKRPEHSDFHGFESRLIDLVTGSELGRSRDLPWIAAKNGDRAVIISNTPYPRAVIARVYGGR